MMCILLLHYQALPGEVYCMCLLSALNVLCVSLSLTGDMQSLVGQDLWRVSLCYYTEVCWYLLVSVLVSSLISPDNVVCFGFLGFLGLWEPKRLAWYKVEWEK